MSGNNDERKGYAMKIKTLKQKILLSVSLALACAILLISGFSYHNLRQQVLDDGYAQIQSLGGEGARSIAEWLTSKQQAASHRDSSQPINPGVSPRAAADQEQRRFSHCLLW